MVTLRDLYDSHTFIYSALYREMLYKGGPSYRFDCNWLLKLGIDGKEVCHLEHYCYQTVLFLTAKVSSLFFYQVKHLASAQYH